MAGSAPRGIRLAGQRGAAVPAGGAIRATGLRAARDRNAPAFAADVGIKRLAAPGNRVTADKITTAGGGVAGALAVGTDPPIASQTRPTHRSAVQRRCAGLAGLGGAIATPVGAGAIGGVWTVQAGIRTGHAHAVSTDRGGVGAHRTGRSRAAAGAVGNPRLTDPPRITTAVANARRAGWLSDAAPSLTRPAHTRRPIRLLPPALAFLALLARGTGLLLGRNVVGLGTEETQRAAKQATEGESAGPSRG
jgi:hypothetical protein